ncbi:uncharacterized protein LOC134277156 [Saccostrea cucullata]|uniref:uncharacterized protein LOC134277156 n=1 Tax=Saccostrea cuccullata TaxID=36930 RepID=UPI002ED61D18
MHEIQYDNEGKRLYNKPNYITENRNGNGVVSDWVSGVVVTDRGCRHRFSYTGSPSRSRLRPLGICTEALSSILVCDYTSGTIQMIDSDGHFLSLILRRQQDINRPHSLGYDYKSHLLWIHSAAVTVDIMDAIKFISQSKVRQCSKCQRRETLYYCDTCKHDLCLLCKKQHVIDLHTIYHDVMIYREKYGYLSKKENCRRHKNQFYEKYCNSCKLPICRQCKEHRQHNVQNIHKVYKAKRQLEGETIHEIRSETLYNSCFLLEWIKINRRGCDKRISNIQSMLTQKNSILMEEIDNFIAGMIGRHNSLIHRLKLEKRKLLSTEMYARKFDQLVNSPVRLLLFLKSTHQANINEIPKFTQYKFHFLTADISIEDVVKLLKEIKVKEGKRIVRNRYLLKLMPEAVLHRSVPIKGVHNIEHITCFQSERFWVSLPNKLILPRKASDPLYNETYKRAGMGVHTVTITGDLIYIDRDYNINKLSKDTKTSFTLVKKAKPWIPLCIASSHSNGDILVGMWNYNKAEVKRYNKTGEHMQTIPQGKSNQGLFGYPLFITENRNGDIVVSDKKHGAVVVTTREGRHRLSYKGPSSRLQPLGICTDALSHILVCDDNTNTVHMIDEDGNFLSKLLTKHQGIKKPKSLCYDERTHMLWVGSSGNRINVYSYIERKHNFKM